MVSSESLDYSTGPRYVWLLSNKVFKRLDSTRDLSDWMDNDAFLQQVTLLSYGSDHTSSGRVCGFWGDAYTVRKWTRNLGTKIRKSYRRNRETNGAFQKHLYHHQRIQRNTEMLFANDLRFPITILACLPWLFASCVVWDVETGSRFLRTLCASLPWFCVQLDFYAYFFAEICVNATAVLPFPMN